MMNSLLTKFYNNFAIIYVQYSPKSSYIKYYNIIRASHGQLNSLKLKEQTKLSLPQLSLQPNKFIVKSFLFVFNIFKEPNNGNFFF